jgi:hypothetical protein
MNFSLRLLAAPRGRIPVPTPPNQSSDRHHWGFSLGDFSMLCYGVHHPWIWINLLFASVASWKAVVSFRPSFMPTIRHPSFFHVCKSRRREMPSIVGRL